MIYERFYLSVCVLDVVHQKVTGVTVKRKSLDFWTGKGQESMRMHWDEMMVIFEELRCSEKE